MSQAAEVLLVELRARGVRVEARGADLRVNAPRGAVDEAQRDRLRLLKPDLLRLLQRPSETVVFVDFETRSLAKLKTVGSRAYAEHESTEVLCAAFLLPDGEKITWVPPAPMPRRIQEHVDGGFPFVGHNVEGFDRFIWCRLGWPLPSRWVDTLTLAKIASYPERGRSLAALGEKLAHQAKDTEGNKLTLSLSRADRKTKQLRAVEAPELERVVTYCAADVDLNAGIFETLAVFDKYEQDVRVLDRVINDRGLCFDVELARAVIECDESSVKEARELANISSDVLSSPAKLKDALVARGVELPTTRRQGVEVQTVSKEALATVLSRDISDEARALIDARLAAAPIASKKLRTALRRVSRDGRLRDTLAYYAAHTGRWGGRGFQPQNLPRGVDGLDVERAVDAALRRDVVRLRTLAKEHGVSLVDVMASLVRPCVRAPDGKWLGVVDYSQIEARALAWLAGDADAVALFREGRDPYRALASELFDVAPEEVTTDQRLLGKIATLGCGYQMGPERFAAQASAGGVDWSRLSITPEHVVHTWREAHPAIVRLWNKLQEVSRSLARGGGPATRIGPLLWGRNGDCVVCELPSGRKLIYREARLEKLPKSKWPGFTYLDGFGKRASGYGGKLAENVVQALCRDILAHALLAVERAGFPVVLHVHDEIVTELDCESGVDAVRALMTAGPRWADGLPLACEGHAARRYSK